VEEAIAVGTTDYTAMNTATCHISNIYHQAHQGETMKFLLCQQDSAPGNKGKNIATMKKMVERNPGDVYIFPELNVTGYYMKDEVTKLAEPLDGPSLQAIAELAEKHAVHIVCGMPILEEDTNIRNAAFLLTPDGKMFHYFKSYLPNFLPFEEKLYFRRAMERQNAVETPFGKVGLLICYDIFYSEVCQNYAKQGVDFLICISAAPTVSRRLFEIMGPARAVEATAFFAYVNTVGSEEKLNFFGGSELHHPRGYRMVKGAYFEETVIEVEVDMAELRVARSMRPVLRDRNWAWNEKLI